MAVVVAIAVPVVIAAVGLGIDLGRLSAAKSSLKNAVDAGAMAGSLKLPYDPNLTQNIVSKAAKDMVAKNYPAATVSGVTAGTDVRSVCVAANASVSLTLLSVLSSSTQTISASSCAGYNNLDVVLVMDNTGSMSGTPIQNVDTAATDLVNLIMTGTNNVSKVGLVPFRGMVRVKSGVDTLAAGCRNADGTLNTGALLTAYKATTYRNPKNSSLNVSSDTCSNIPYIQPLTTDTTVIKNAISTMNASGNGSGTVIAEGIKWGRDVLNGPHYTQGVADTKFRKVMILLTDGNNEDGTCGGTYGTSQTPNNYWTNAYYGYGNMNCHCGDYLCLDQAMLSEAQKTKDAGIEIFTIRFGDSTTAGIAKMKTMASSTSGTTDHYYNAPSAADISTMFKSIGTQLGLKLLN